jgi:hypothetical protein
MFLENKYKKWYFLIIDNAKKRELCDIKESHHIIPKSLGGNNDAANLVELTPREHFICHWLLTKMTTGHDKHKMTFSLHTFFHFNKHRRLNFNSRQYEYHKKVYREACRHKPPFRKKEVFRFKHYKTGDEFIGTRYEFSKYSGLTPQEINWLVNYCIKPEEPKKLIKRWGVWIDKLNIFSYNKPRPKLLLNTLPDITCENCGKTVNNGNYKRWHGNRCKLIDPEGHYERTRQVATINKS